MLRPLFGNLENLKVGDTVVVHTYHHKHEGVVIKRGRVLLTVEYGGSTDMFRMNTGQFNGESNNLRIYSIEQEDYNRRLDAALHGLREVGLDARTSCNLSLETLEAMLDLIKEMTV